VATGDANLSATLQQISASSADIAEAQVNARIERALRAEIERVLKSLRSN
jgi:hypothetical protein